MKLDRKAWSLHLAAIALALSCASASGGVLVTCKWPGREPIFYTFEIDYERNQITYVSTGSRYVAQISDASISWRTRQETLELNRYNGELKTYTPDGHPTIIYRCTQSEKKF